MRQFVERDGRLGFRTLEQFAWRQRDAISGGTVKGLRATTVDCRSSWHSRDYLFGGGDRLVPIGLDLRQVIDNRLKQFALFEIVG